jgi:hypothetical protein
MSTFSSCGIGVETLTTWGQSCGGADGSGEDAGGAQLGLTLGGHRVPTAEQILESLSHRVAVERGVAVQ